MSHTTLMYDLLAKILSYPARDYLAIVREFQPMAQELFPEKPGLLDTFVYYVETTSGPEIEEYFTRSFDLSPVCCLEVGWHLFGENYERGEFLVRMREQLRRHGVSETSDLPDHLGRLLLLLARMERNEAAELAGQFVLPALGKIKDAVGDNVYGALIAAIEARLETDYPDAPRRPAQLPIFQEAACE